MFRLIIFLLAFLYPFHTFAADSVSAIANRIQNAYGNINAFNAEFTQTLTHKESGAIEKRNGTIQFQKPLRIRWQTNKPHEEILIVNSNEIWNYIPEEEIAYRYSPEVAMDSRHIIQVITGQSKLDKDFTIKKGSGENGLTKLVLIPKEPTPDLVEAAIWVDPATGVIQRANAIDFYGNINDISFKTFKPISKIPEKQFSFLPPKGIEIEDRMENKVPEKKLFN